MRIANYSLQESGNFCSNSTLSAWIFWTAFGALAAVSIDIVGKIYLGEIFALIFFVPLIRARRWHVPHSWILIISALFIIAQIASDMYNNRPLAESLKGECAPLVFCISILTYFMLFSERPTRAYATLAGVAITNLIQTALFPDAYAMSNPWKWGYGGAALILLCIFFSSRNLKRVRWLIAAMLIFTLVSMAYGARSLGGLPIVGLFAYLFWKSKALPRMKRWLLGRLAPLRLMLLIVPLVLLINATASGIFASRWSEALVGQSLAEKYQRQASSPLGLLLSARSESLVSIQAFLDAPFLGHGSWAVDPKYVLEYSNLRDKYGLADDSSRGSSGELIPTHSFLFGALVWAGIMGGLFWCILTYRIIHRYLHFAARLPVYFHVFSVIFIWNVLFSPFGASARWAEALFIAVLFSVTSAMRLPASVIGLRR